MKICLAVAFQNEAAWLNLHLTPELVAKFDGLIALDGGSQDGGRLVIERLGGKVIDRPFDWNFGAHMNYLLNTVEGMETFTPDQMPDGYPSPYYDAIVRMDPDEAMFPEDVDVIRKELKSGKAELWMLQRINFIRDRLHFNPEFQPWGQWRAWLLHKGIKYWNVRVHENPQLPKGLHTASSKATLFHYAYLKDPRERAWRSAMYGELGKNENGQNAAGVQLTLDARDAYSHLQLPWPAEPIRYKGKQPRDPFEIGVRAPLELIQLNFHISPNLLGDRQVEYGFVVDRTPRAEASLGRQALDFGWGGNLTVFTGLERRGWMVTLYDRESFPSPRTGFTVVQGDILQDDLGGSRYELITCCSSIEHVGLVGRYGTREDEGDPDGDLKAMRKLWGALAPGGKLIMTIPVGFDYVHGSMHRVYGISRLTELFKGFDMLESVWYFKDSEEWLECDMEKTLTTRSIATSPTDWQGCYYALGCFVLEKPAEE